MSCGDVLLSGGHDGTTSRDGGQVAPTTYVGRGNLLAPTAGGSYRSTGNRTPDPALQRFASGFDGAYKSEQ